MRLSVITVCYNASRTIARTMESVFAQRTEHEIDYLVIDGGSTDGTADIVRRLAEAAPSRVTVRWSSEPDRGMYDALNKGIARATGEVIGILNADDRFTDEHVLDEVAGAFGDGVECIYGDVRFVRDGGEKTVRYYSSGPWRPWMHNWGYMPAHPTVYVRRAVFDRFGLYRLGYEISADFEWMVRILCRGGIAARYLPRCLVTMTLGGRSTAGWKALWRLNCENVRANRANGYFSCLPMMIPKYAYKAAGYLFRH